MSPPGAVEPGFDYALMKTIGLVVFFSIFAVILLRLALGSRQKYDQASRIPLEDEPVDDRQASQHGVTRR